MSIKVHKYIEYEIKIITLSNAEFPQVSDLFPKFYVFHLLYMCWQVRLRSKYLHQNMAVLLTGIACTVITSARCTKIWDKKLKVSLDLGVYCQYLNFSFYYMCWQAKWQLLNVVMVFIQMLLTPGLLTRSLLFFQNGQEKSQGQEAIRRRSERKTGQ